MTSTPLLPPLPLSLNCLSFHVGLQQPEQPPMPLTPRTQTRLSLSTRIDRWRRQIDEDTSKPRGPIVQDKLQARQGGDKKGTSTHGHHTRLQARNLKQRTALAETSANPRLRQQKSLQNHTIPTPLVPRATAKRARSMSGDGEVPAASKKRGRPRKDTTSESSHQAANTHLPEELLASLPISQSRHHLVLRGSEASLSPRADEMN